MIHEDPELRDARGIYRDRRDAGRRLAALLQREIALERPTILAIPAGGVPVGIELARAFGAKLRLAIVRKIQIPWNPEAGFGAVAWDGSILLNEPLVMAIGLPEEEIEECIQHARNSVRERMEEFREMQAGEEIAGREVVVTDDGLASGFTMLAAVRASIRFRAERVVVAVPTSSVNAAELVSQEADELVCSNIRYTRAFAVADAYRHWHDLGEDDVMHLLEDAAREGLV